MPKGLAGLLLRQRIVELDALTALYQTVRDPKAIAERQLHRFNIHWEHAWREIPFYRTWKAENGLPDRINDIHDLQSFPLLTKHDISKRRETLSATPGVERHTLTGGTSGISTAFPMNSADATSAWTNTHLGRRWNGIEPGDALLMIWGHSHLFSGKAAWRKHIKRRIKDWAANITRVSAYNLTASELDGIAAAIARTRPRYVIGYGSCLGQLVHHLRDRDADLREAGVKRVVNTSETMYSEDARVVAEIFGCPVINEYGMAEAGVIGYSRGELYPITVFWNDYIVRVVNERIVITTLGKRCFPLINYDTEDLCDDLVPQTGAILELSSIRGKARDIVVLRDRDGNLNNISVVLFDHVLKQIPQLRSLHYTQLAGARVRVDFTAEGAPLDVVVLQTKFAAGLAKEGVHIEPGETEFVRLDAPLQTIAGKRVTLKKEMA